MADNVRIVYCLEHVDNNKTSLAETLSYKDMTDEGAFIYLKSKDGEVLQIKDESTAVLEELEDNFIQIGREGNPNVKLSMMFLSDPGSPQPKIELEALMQGIDKESFLLYMLNNKQKEPLVHFLPAGMIWSTEADNYEDRLRILKGVYSNHLLNAFDSFVLEIKHKITADVETTRIPEAMYRYMYSALDSVIELLEVEEVVTELDAANLDQILTKLDYVGRNGNFRRLDIPAATTNLEDWYYLTINIPSNTPNKYTPPAAFNLQVYANSLHGTNRKTIDVMSLHIDRGGTVLGGFKPGYNIEHGEYDKNLLGIYKGKLVVRGRTRLHLLCDVRYNILFGYEKVTDPVSKVQPRSSFRNAEYLGESSYHAHTMMLSSNMKPFLLNTGFIQESTAGSDKHRKQANHDGYDIRGKVMVSGLNSYSGAVIKSPEKHFSTNVNRDLYAYLTTWSDEWDEVGRQLHKRPAISRSIYNDLTGFYEPISLIENDNGAHFGTMITTVTLTELRRGLDGTLLDTPFSYYKLNNLGNHLRESGTYHIPFEHNDLNMIAYTFDILEFNEDGTYVTQSDYDSNKPWSRDPNAGLVDGIFSGRYKSHMYNTGNPTAYGQYNGPIPDVFNFSYKMNYTAVRRPIGFYAHEKGYYPAEIESPIKIKDLAGIRNKSLYHMLGGEFAQKGHYDKSVPISLFRFIDASIMSINNNLYPTSYSDSNSNTIVKNKYFQMYGMNISDNNQTNVEAKILKAIQDRWYSYGINNTGNKKPMFGPINLDNIIPSGQTISVTTHNIYNTYNLGWFGNIPAFGLSRNAHNNSFMSIKNYPTHWLKSDNLYSPEYMYDDVKFPNVSFNVHLHKDDGSINDIPTISNENNFYKKYYKMSILALEKCNIPRYMMYGGTNKIGGMDETADNGHSAKFICRNDKPSHPTIRFTKRNSVTQNPKISYMAKRHLPMSVCVKHDFLKKNGIGSYYIYRPQNLIDGIGLPEHDGTLGYKIVFNKVYFLDKSIMNDKYEMRVYPGVYTSKIPPENIEDMVEYTFTTKDINGVAFEVDCTGKNLLKNAFKFPSLYHNHLNYSTTLAHVLHGAHSEEDRRVHDLLYSIYNTPEAKAKIDFTVIQIDEEEKKDTLVNEGIAVPEIRIYSNLTSEHKDTLDTGRLFSRYMFSRGVYFAKEEAGKPFLVSATTSLGPIFNLNSDLNDIAKHFSLKSAFTHTNDTTYIGRQLNPNNFLYRVFIDKLAKKITTLDAEYGTIYFRIGRNGDREPSEWVRIPLKLSWGYGKQTF